MRVNLLVYVLKLYLMERGTLVVNSNAKNVDSFSLRKHENKKQGINFHQNLLRLLFQDGLMHLVLLVPEHLTFEILNIHPF